MGGSADPQTELVALVALLLLAGLWGGLICMIILSRLTKLPFVRRLVR